MAGGLDVTGVDKTLLVDLNISVGYVHPIDDVCNSGAVFVLRHGVEKFLVHIGKIAVDAADNAAFDRTNRPVVRDGGVKEGDGWASAVVTPGVVPRELYEVGVALSKGDKLV